MSAFLQDGEEAQRIASTIPYYPFHGIDRFYDISGMLHDPEAFQLCVNIFSKRYENKDINCIAGVDARGFVLGRQNCSVFGLKKKHCQKCFLSFESIADIVFLPHQGHQSL